MPANDRLPAFLFFVNDFLADEKVMAMTTRQVGAYVLILCRAWHQEEPGTVPDDDELLRTWSRLSETDWQHDRARVLSPFVRVGMRLHQKRMMDEFRIQLERSEHGRNAANARWKLRHGCSGINRASSEHMLGPAASNASKSSQVKSTQGEHPQTPSLIEHVPDQQNGEPIDEPEPPAKPPESTQASDLPAKPQRQAKPRSDAYSPDFESFWLAFPRTRRTGKRQAWKAWKAACVRAPTETIMTGATEYAASPLGRSSFACLPATWLNGDRWLDDRESWQRGDDKPKGAKHFSAAEYLANSKINDSLFQ